MNKSLKNDAYLIERFYFCVHDEIEFAEFTRSRLRCGQPLLQATLVHKFQASCESEQRFKLYMILHHILAGLHFYT